MKLSTTFIELQKEAIKLENDTILIKNTATKILDIYDIFFKHGKYEKCKLILDELFECNIEIMDYIYLSSLMPSIYIDSRELPFIMPESGFKYKINEFFKFHNMRQFINFTDKSDIPKHIIFTELLPRNIHRFYNHNNDNYLKGVEFLLKNKEHFRTLSTNVDFMDSIKKISQELFDYLERSEQHKKISQELFDYLERSEDYSVI